MDVLLACITFYEILVKQCVFEKSCRLTIDIFRPNSLHKYSLPQQLTNTHIPMEK